MCMCYTFLLKLDREGGPPFGFESVPKRQGGTWDIRVCIPYTHIRIYISVVWYLLTEPRPKRVMLRSAINEMRKLSKAPAAAVEKSPRNTNVPLISGLVCHSATYHLQILRIAARRSTKENPAKFRLMYECVSVVQKQFIPTMRRTALRQ